MYLWRKRRVKRRRRNHQPEPLAKEYESPVPAEVHRGDVHPGKPYMPLHPRLGTVSILCLPLGRGFIHLCFESISETEGPWDGSGGDKNLAFISISCLQCACRRQTSQRSWFRTEVTLWALCSISVEILCWLLTITTKPFFVDIY